MRQADYISLAQTPSIYVVAILKGIGEFTRQKFICAHDVHNLFCWLFVGLLLYLKVQYEVNINKGIIDEIYLKQQINEQSDQHTR